MTKENIRKQLVSVFTLLENRDQAQKKYAFFLLEHYIKFIDRFKTIFMYGAGKWGGNNS